MTGQEHAEEIIKLWNSGDKEGAKKLYQKYQMVLSEKIKEFLKKKMILYCDLKGIYIYKKPIKQDEW